MKTTRLLFLSMLVAIHSFGQQPAVAWQEARPGWVYAFPRDHGVHPSFKTEWWYFTGQLIADDGREFGYELTWFRQGVLPALAAGARSRFLVHDFKFAHFAVTDVASGQFNFAQRISRGSYGESGFGNGSPGKLAWIDDWRLTVEPGGIWRIEAGDQGRRLDLRLTPQKGPVIEGENGVSEKSQEPGHASCYYSYTRMQAQGLLTLPGGRPLAVAGDTWFDHEWATNQLAANQAGWDWFSLQLSDGTELMLYRMRLKSGVADQASSGTYVRRDGAVVYLKAADFSLTPLEWWQSATTAASYPVRWSVDIPRLGLKMEVATPVKNQELAIPGLAYWEGLIHVTGSVANAPVTGHGYLELTGYERALTGMSN